MSEKARADEAKQSDLTDLLSVASDYIAALENKINPKPESDLAWFFSKDRTERIEDKKAKWDALRDRLSSGR